MKAWSMSKSCTKTTVRETWGLVVHLASNVCKHVQWSGDTDRHRKLHWEH